MVSDSDGRNESFRSFESIEPIASQNVSVHAGDTCWSEVCKYNKTQDKTSIKTAFTNPLQTLSRKYNILNAIKIIKYH